MGKGPGFCCTGTQMDLSGSATWGSEGFIPVSCAAEAPVGRAGAFWGQFIIKTPGFSFEQALIFIK